MNTTTSTTTVTGGTDAALLAARYLRSPDHGWSVGIPGAIGEFMYDDGEDVTFGGHGNVLSAVTARGGIRITLPVRATAVALEEIAECTGGWNQCVAFCAEAGEARIEALDVLTEVGPDDDALTAQGRGETLFDLGLGSAQVRFCVRTADPALLDVLRTGAGRSIFAPDNPVFTALRDASPARVVISALGRVEIFQSIAAKGGASPRGPHTHLLPALLKHGADADTLLPPGTVAPLRLYPEHPLYDKYGTPTPFRQPAHDAFQALLARHGHADYVAVKARYLRALVCGPAAAVAAPGRTQPDWTAYAVAMSQARVPGVAARCAAVAPAH
jgi:hypothetical protein